MASYPLRQLASAREVGEERPKRWRLPAPGRDERTIDESAFAVAQCSAVQPVDAPARRKNDGVPRCRVPFAGRAKPGVDVGFSLGDDAEFE